MTSLTKVFKLGRIFSCFAVRTSDVSWAPPLFSSIIIQQLVHTYELNTILLNHAIYVCVWITQRAVWETRHRLQGDEGEASSAKAAESSTSTTQWTQVEPIRKKRRPTHGWCENRTGSNAVWSKILINLNQIKIIVANSISRYM